MIPPNKPEEQGKHVVITWFVDADHAGDYADRCIHTGILLFFNKAPIHWYSKEQSTVKASTLCIKFSAMKTSMEMVEALRYKLRMFGVPINWPCSVFYDNEAMYKNMVLPESTLREKHHLIVYHGCCEAVAAGIIWVAKQGTTKNLADIFTKVLTAARQTFLLEQFTYLALTRYWGVWFYPYGFSTCDSW